jgi:hypothetical protein
LTFFLYFCSPNADGGDAIAYPMIPWEIHSVADLPSYALTEVVDTLTGALLIEVQPDGSVSGQQRFVLDGLSILDLDIQANKMVSCAGSSGFSLKWQVWPRDIKLRPNAFTSDWFDLTDR